MSDTVVLDNHKAEKEADPKALTRKILTLYMSGAESMPEDLRARCQDWLCLDRNWDIKEEVLKHYFDEAMDSTHIPAREDREGLKALREKLGMPE